MFGLVVKFIIKEGRREDFLRIMSEGIRDMPGCHSYILAADAADPDGVWVTEIWDTQESHDAGIGLPHIKAATAEAKPLTVRRDLRVVTTPFGGHGL